MTSSKKAPARSHGGGGWGTPAVTLLCITCFFAGRFISLPAGLPEAGTGPTIVDEGSPVERRSALENATVEAEAAAEMALPPPEVLEEAARSLAEVGQYESAEEALDAVGFLSDRPPGEHGETGHSFYTVQPMQLLSLYPRAYLMPHFLSKKQCNHVIEMAKRRLAPSGLAFKAGDTPESTRDVRTSSGTFMSRQEDPKGVLAWIEDKIAAVTMIPVGNGEPFNILRYDQNQHYHSHYDSFSEEDYGLQFSQRIATVLLYLSDVDKGGETVFLLEGKDGLGRLERIDYKACDTGIRVRPRMGDALLFFSVATNGTIDKHSLHGGCPVLAGTKWVATRWLRNRCFGVGC